MADFNKIVNFVIDKIEGSYSWDKKDVGNYPGRNVKNVFIGTKWGISAATLYDNGIKLTQQQMYALTKTEAIKLYKRLFWDPSNIGLIQNDGIAFQFFDHLINGGNIKRVKANLSVKYPWIVGGTPYKLSVDAVKKINAFDSLKLFNDIKSARISAYKALKRQYADWYTRPGKWVYRQLHPGDSDKKKRNNFPISNSNSNDWLNWVFGKAVIKKPSK